MYHQSHATIFREIHFIKFYIKCYYGCTFYNGKQYFIRKTLSRNNYLNILVLLMSYNISAERIDDMSRNNTLEYIRVPLCDKSLNGTGVI